MLEKGFICFNGSPTTHDQCTEICGDGINLGLVWCDDGNNFSGDGCTSACHIERGFNCTGGSKTTPDKCVEICGDGINLGYYECDDGNVQNGDGCNSICQVEPNY